MFKAFFLVSISFFGIHSAQAQTPACSPGQHWDTSMNPAICMPNAPAPVDHGCKPDEVWEDDINSCVPNTAPPSNSCPPRQHWDETMRPPMCMPDLPTPPTNPNDPHGCGAGQEWDTSMGMCMPVASANSRSPLVGFHLNQFLVRGIETGPRGRNDFYAPNMWMLTVDEKISVHNKLRVSFMGTTDK